jgi:predicted ester cyclase
MDLFQVENGVLVGHWALLDNLSMQKQLGTLA